MPIAIKRFDSSPWSPYSFEVNALSALFLLIHMERMPGIKVIAQQSTLATGDFDGYFTFQNYQFVVSTPFANTRVWCTDQSAPENIFAAIEEHVKNYRPVRPHHLLHKIIKYALLPATPRLNTAA